MQVVCMWCHQLVDMPADHRCSRPFLIDGVAHYYTRRRGKRKKPAQVVPPPVLTWAEIEARARQFWAERHAANAFEFAA